MGEMAIERPGLHWPWGEEGGCPPWTHKIGVSREEQSEPSSPKKWSVTWGRVRAPQRRSCGPRAWGLIPLEMSAARGKSGRGVCFLHLSTSTGETEVGRKE